jgi:microsomal dipeptidase-like Zn-dependent dipeptidase
VIVDVAHASAATIDDVLAIATRPVVASHTGVRAVATTPGTCRTTSCARIAATGGLIGIGFWPTACGGESVEWIARSIAHAVASSAPTTSALGSDFDGAVPVPFDASGMGS